MRVIEANKMVCGFSVLKHSSHFSYVAVLTKRPLALCICLILDLKSAYDLVKSVVTKARDKCERRAHELLYFVVSSERRGSGVGELLMRDTRQFYKKLGVSEFAVTVEIINRDAIKFYLKKRGISAGQYSIFGRPYEMFVFPTDFIKITRK